VGLERGGPRLDCGIVEIGLGGRNSVVGFSGLMIGDDESRAVDIGGFDAGIK